MRLLFLAVLPLLSGCLSTVPNLSPVPLGDGHAEASAVGGVAYNRVIGDSHDMANATPALWGGSARVGLSERSDWGVEVLRIPSADQSQVRVSWRSGTLRGGTRPVATLLYATYATAENMRGGYVGISRVKARRWSAHGVVYTGLHAIAGTGYDPTPGYYEVGNPGSVGVGAQIGGERRFGQMFVRAEGGVTYVLPWYLQGSGLVSAGVRF